MARRSTGAPAHGLAGHGEGMDARVEATQEWLPDARQAPSGVSFSLGHFSFGQAKEKYLALRRRVKALRSDAEMPGAEVQKRFRPSPE